MVAGNDAWDNIRSIAGRFQDLPKITLPMRRDTPAMNEAALDRDRKKNQEIVGQMPEV